MERALKSGFKSFIFKTGQLGGEIDKAAYLRNKLVLSCKNLKEVQLPPSGTRTCERPSSQKLRPTANKRRRRVWERRFLRGKEVLHFLLWTGCVGLPYQWRAEGEALIYEKVWLWKIRGFIVFMGNHWPPSTQYECDQDFSLSRIWPRSSWWFSDNTPDLF